MVKSEKPRVLLIDDNEPTCTLMTALLQKDFAVDVATDGYEAIDKLRVKTYSAIILDLLMPNLDGYGVLDYLRANNPEMLRRVLVVSAALGNRDWLRVHEYNVCAVISKPFEVETLLGAVRQCADPAAMRSHLLTGGMILLLAEVLKNRWM